MMVRSHDRRGVSAPGRVRDERQELFCKYCSSLSSLPSKASGKLFRGCDLVINCIYLLGSFCKSVMKRDSAKEAFPLTGRMRFRPRKGRWEAKGKFQAP